MGETGKWVLVPGTLCTERVFEPILDALGVRPSNRHFIAVDAPDVRDYGDRLQSAVTGGEVVCGFSLGALVLAHNLGALQRARAVVLLASNPFPDPPGNRYNREVVRDRILAGDVRGWVADNWPSMSARDDVKERVAEMAEDSVHLISAQTELAASRPGAVDQLIQSTLPLVFVTGSEDRMTPASALTTIAETAKRAHLSVLDGLGHFALIEAPDRVAKAIRNGLVALDPQYHSEDQTHEA